MSWRNTDFDVETCRDLVSERVDSQILNIKNWDDMDDMDDTQQDHPKEYRLDWPRKVGFGLELVICSVHLIFSQVIQGFQNLFLAQPTRDHAFHVQEL